jgi:hypothetical protein
MGGAVLTLLGTPHSLDAPILPIQRLVKGNAGQALSFDDNDEGSVVAAPRADYLQKPKTRRRWWNNEKG